MQYCPKGFKYYDMYCDISNKNIDAVYNKLYIELNKVVSDRICHTLKDIIDRNNQNIKGWDL